MGVMCSTHGNDEKCMYNCDRKHEVTHRRSLYNNIKMEEIRCQGVD
jgi:hypothetical protein